MIKLSHLLPSEQTLDTDKYLIRSKKRSVCESFWGETACVGSENHQGTVEGCGRHCLCDEDNLYKAPDAFY